ncbi:MAG: hypothetical protein ACK4G1_03920 [Ignavibacteria bacterium]
MKLKNVNNQDLIKSHMISLSISFVFFNAILRNADWLIFSTIVFLIALNIVIKIWGRKLDAGVNEKTNYTRRMI